jgi:hypothetical protein
MIFSFEQQNLIWIIMSLIWYLFWYRYLSHIKGG